MVFIVDTLNAVPFVTEQYRRYRVRLFDVAFWLDSQPAQSSRPTLNEWAEKLRLLRDPHLQHSVGRDFALRELIREDPIFIDYMAAPESNSTDESLAALTAFVAGHSVRKGLETISRQPEST